MMLQADSVAVAGAHAPLLLATSVTARAGEVTLVAGDPGYGQVALALALGGRLAPSAGSIRIQGVDDPQNLRSTWAWLMCPALPSPNRP